MYDNTYENNKIMFIALTNSVKKKKENFEDFIKKNFTEYEKHKCFLFNHKGNQGDSLIGLKTKKSNYVFLLKREKHSHYFVAIDMQKRNDISFNDDANICIEMEMELKISSNLQRRDKEEAKEELADKIEEVYSFEPYKTPSLSDNEEFKKWSVHLTLMKEMIDKKDFFIETDVFYKDKKAIVDVSHTEDDELLTKIKQARGQDFLYYESNEVDTSKPISSWDEKDNRNRKFAKLEEIKNNELVFKLDDEFMKQQKNKAPNKDIIKHSDNQDSFLLQARQYIEATLRSIDKNIAFSDKGKTKIIVANSIKNLKLPSKEESSVLELWNKLSNIVHGNENAENNKSFMNQTNTTLEILRKMLPENKNAIPSKLILRVSYFRDIFQLRVLQNGLKEIEKHPLRAYLFGDKKIPKIDEEEINHLKVDYLSTQLNDKQKEVVKKSILANDIFMIQGPPGTGKTEVISEIAYQEAIKGKKVLITSQANMAVDNALQRLTHPALYPVRIIRKDYEPEDGDSLPTRENAGTFYQNRIISNLSKTLSKNKNHKNKIKLFLEQGKYNDDFISIVKELKIEVSSNLNFNQPNDKEDFKRTLANDKNKKILEDKLNKLEQKEHFREIQKDFLEEFKDSENGEFKEEIENLSKNYLENVNIWGATLFETGKRSFQDLEFDIVIVDEVSKATPPELVLPILKAEKIILVGDHKQLPPIIKDVSLEDLAKEMDIDLKLLDFDTTVFEKLINNNPHSYVMLDTQYRMHPDIQEVINQFYKDENNDGLKCGLTNPSIERNHEIQDEMFKDKRLVWIKTSSNDKEEKVGTSFKNKKEIDLVKTTLNFLDEQYKTIGKIPSVGVITFYGNQLRELRKLEKQRFWKLPQEKKEYSNLDLSFGTVDRFQGQEKDIIIVSLVRNNHHRNLGFAKKPNRVNVAFSRAKNLLIIVGNIDNFRFANNEQASKMYRNIFNITRDIGTIRDIKEQK